MIITIFLWLIYFFIFYSFGLGVKWLLFRKEKQASFAGGLTQTVLMGLVIVTAITLILSLFLPMKIPAFALLFTGALVILLILILKGEIKNAIKKSFCIEKDWLKIAFYILIFLFILFNSTQISKNPDSGQYHVQAIHWSETYPVVPGLGNLHDRLAYNSSWLVLIAMFSFSFIPNTSFHVLPGFLCLIIAWGMLEKVHFKHFHVSTLYPLLFLPLFFFTNVSELSSPGTDLPVILVIAGIVGMYLNWIKDPQSEPHTPVLLFGLIFWSLTVKLSAIPIVIFIFLLVLPSKKRVGLIKNGAVFGFLLILPWMIRNLILSGYPLFPSTAFGWFNFDWKMPIDQVHDEQIAIRGWSRFPRIDPNEILAMPLKSWVKIWFLYQTINRRILILAALFLPVLHFSFSGLSFGFRKLSKRSGSLFTISTLFAGVLFWFFSAPNIRFGFAFLLPIIAVCISIFVIWLGSFFQVHLQQKTLVLSGLVTLIFIGVLFFQSVEFQKFSDHFFQPAPYPELPSEPCSLGNQTISCASLYNECWYSPFPCIPQSVENVYMRGDNYGHGFYYQKD